MARSLHRVLRTAGAALAVSCGEGGVFPPEHPLVLRSPSAEFIESSIALPAGLYRARVATA